MPDPVLLAVSLVIGSLAVQLLVVFYRNSRSYRTYLESQLAQHGLRYVSAAWPGLFRVGPFPKVEVEVGRPQTRVVGFRGEYAEYRIVTFEAPGGDTFQLWAKLEFERFRIHRIRWRAEHGQRVPKQAQALLKG